MSLFQQMDCLWLGEVRLNFVCSGTTQKLWLFRHAQAAVAHFGQNKFWDSEASAGVALTRT